MRCKPGYFPTPPGWLHRDPRVSAAPALNSLPTARTLPGAMVGISNLVFPPLRPLQALCGATSTSARRLLPRYTSSAVLGPMRFRRPRATRSLGDRGITFRQLVSKEVGERATSWILGKTLVGEISVSTQEERLRMAIREACPKARPPRRWDLSARRARGSRAPGYAVRQAIRYNRPHRWSILL